MKAFSLLVALMALSSLGGNGNGSMNLREKSIDTNRPNGWYYITSGKQDSLSAEPIVTTKDFASISLDSSLNERTGEMIYQIVGRVNEQSIEVWADATERSIGKHIGFVCNNKVVCNPRVNARIPNGYFAISGKFKRTLETKKFLQNTRKHGKKPARYANPLPTLPSLRLNVRCQMMQSVLTITTQD